jgi:hypothetical protein
MQVVKEAIADHKKELAGAWNLHPRLADIGKFKCKYTTDPREHLPRADMTYEFKSSAGKVSVHITSAGETFRIEINAGKNPMAAKLACTDLEKISPSSPLAVDTLSHPSWGVDF